MSTDEQKADVVMFTHLLSWLPQAYDHCQFGSREWCDSYLNNAVDTITALQKRINELEGALRECVVALHAAEERDHRARFRANSPRGDAEVIHLRESAIRIARSTLKDSGNGSEAGE